MLRGSDFEIRKRSRNLISESNKKSVFGIRRKMSRMDLRQALAGLLTLSMFIMLGNMVKKDHIDPLLGIEDLQKISAVSRLGSPNSKGKELKSCWNLPISNELENSKGFITFSLTNGPEYHRQQIADAVMVAKSLGATLVLPDIRSNKQGYRMNFGDIYDIDDFLSTLNGLVSVTRTMPPEASSSSKGNVPIVKVPNMVSEDYIMRVIKPVFQSKGVLRIESTFPSINSTMEDLKEKKSMHPLACKAMFGSLKLQKEVEELVVSMMGKLRNWSMDQNGMFIAVDLRSEKCDDNGRGRCLKAEEIGEFLKKLGLSQESVVYVTQPRWDSHLDSLRDFFPKTFTKESVIPASKRGKFLNAEIAEYEKVIDFYICSESEMFVSSSLTPSGVFYDSVAAMRIALGTDNIIVPNSHQIASSASLSDFMSPYVSQKTHFAYSCFC